jgi:hypothetical protein
MAVRLSAVLYSPGRFLVLISVSGFVKATVIMRLEIFSKLKKIDLVGNRIRDFKQLRCSVPQFILK